MRLTIITYLPQANVLASARGVEFIRRCEGWQESNAASCQNILDTCYYIHLYSPFR